MLYATRYPLPDGGSAITQVFARDDRHLDELIGLRRMHEVPVHNESVPYPVMPSAHLAKGSLAEAMHALIWCGMIAVRGDETGWNLLSDRGIIHQLAHEMVFQCSWCGGSHRCPQCHDRRYRLLRRVGDFERAVPGVHPVWEGRQEVEPTPMYDGFSAVAPPRTAEEASRLPRRPLRAPTDEELRAKVQIKMDAHVSKLLSGDLQREMIKSLEASFRQMLKEPPRTIVLERGEEQVIPARAYIPRLKPLAAPVTTTNTFVSPIYVDEFSDIMKRTLTTSVELTPEALDKTAKPRQRRAARKATA